MYRIATAILLVAAMIAFNGGMVRQTMAAELAAPRPAASAESTAPIAVRSTKLLNLLMVLETLRQTPVALDAQKV